MNVFRTGMMLVFGLVVASAPACADLVTWTFTDAVMDYQRNVTGSFTYNADTLTVTDFNFVTSGGFDYGYVFAYNPGDAYIYELTSTPSTGTNIVFLQNGPTNAPPVAAEFNLFTPMLTDAGGVMQLGGTNTAEYLNTFPSQSDSFNPNGRGALVGVGATPEPAYYLALGIGLGLLAMARRLRRSGA